MSSLSFALYVTILCQYSDITAIIHKYADYIALCVCLRHVQTYSSSEVVQKYFIKESNHLIWEEFCICNTRYTSTQTRFKKTYLCMIYERFRRYSHLPHQVANNGINCYDTKLSKY